MPVPYESRQWFFREGITYQKRLRCGGDVSTRSLHENKKPDFSGICRAVDRNRTGDLLLTMEMLYRLSYNGLYQIRSLRRCKKYIRASENV